MTNKQLEQKVEKFLEIENYFDFIEAVCDFEKEYKSSDFYKKTKIFQNLYFLIIQQEGQKKFQL